MIHKTIHALSVPIVYIAHHVPHIPGVKKKHVHITFGTLTMFAGVGIAKIPCTGFAHLCFDVIGYSVHAVGLAPILRAMHLE